MPLTAILLLLAQTAVVFSACPNITLPWGIYQASKSVNKGATCIYSNVRFGKKPVRFQRPEAPDATSNPVLQPTQAPSCYQVLPENRSDTAALLGEDWRSPPFAGPLPGDEDETDMSEDCLFADLYIPAAAVNNPAAKLPVVVWLYGGAYVFGSKNTGSTSEYDMPFYSGEGLMGHGQDFIFVTGNYRLGAFGWLAGPTMVEQGTANAGLWDQRLLLDFVDHHITDLGGNPKHVSLWGESAGGGSILHHLTSDPPPRNIKTALLQSPAYLWQWNPTSSGYPAQVYENLTLNCGCGNAQDSFGCLQNLPEDELQACNKKLVAKVWDETGLIPFNPAIDGGLIKNLPTVSFSNGDFAKLDSLLVSHVFDESANFVPSWITSMEKFNHFLEGYMPGDLYQDQRAAIDRQYPASSYPGKKGPFNRAHDVIQDSSFICNTRFIFDAYRAADPPVPTYMMHYAFGAALGQYLNRPIAVHAADLIPTFWNAALTKDTFAAFAHATLGLSKFVAGLVYGAEKSLAAAYQPYLATFGTKGVPRGEPAWKEAKVDAEGLVKDAMDVTLSYGLNPIFTNDFVDPQNGELRCGFWRNMSFWVEQTVQAAREEERRVNKVGSVLIVQDRIHAKVELK